MKNDLVKVLRRLYNGVMGTITDLWQAYSVATDDVGARLKRICAALNEREVPFALVGGQAVVLWVSTRDPAAVRTTKDVDILLDRGDLPRARAAALAAGMDYFELLGVGMFLERDDPNPRHAVHLVWASEKVRPEYELSSPPIDERQELSPGLPVVSLPGLVRMKLLYNRDRDRVHLADMIEVGLIGREMLAGLTPELARRLDGLLSEAGR